MINSSVSAPVITGFVPAFYLSLSDRQYTCWGTAFWGNFTFCVAVADPEKRRQSDNRAVHKG